MKALVIVGSGLAGYHVAKAFRQHDRERPIHIITADDGAYYSKPQLSNALRAGKSADELVLNSSEEMAATLQATLHTQCQVLSVDAAASTVIM